LFLKAAISLTPFGSMHDSPLCKGVRYLYSAIFLLISEISVVDPE
jgi:hypothetical protein